MRWEHIEAGFPLREGDKVRVVFEGTVSRLFPDDGLVRVDLGSDKPMITGRENIMVDFGNDE